jgi:hypothetical protein
VSLTEGSREVLRDASARPGRSLERLLARSLEVLVVPVGMDVERRVCLLEESKGCGFS